MSFALTFPFVVLLDCSMWKNNLVDCKICGVNDMSTVVT